MMRANTAVMVQGNCGAGGGRWEGWNVPESGCDQACDDNVCHEGEGEERAVPSCKGLAGTLSVMDWT